MSSLKRLLGGLFTTGRRRSPAGWVGAGVRLYAACVALYVVWASLFSRTDVLSLTIVFLAAMLTLVFATYGASARSDPLRLQLLDWGLLALSLATTVFFISQVGVIGTRISLLTPLTTPQLFFGAVIVVLTIEATRRTVGAGLTLIALVFIAYNLYGHLIGGIFGHGYISLRHFVDITAFTGDGLFSIPVQVAATYAFLFVLFGTTLEKVKGGEFFYRVSTRLAGHTVGGPAKVSVLASALFGTFSGSPTSDVVTTGSINIPVMQRFGFPAATAAAVEVAASTGGSLMPPIMGSAAFIMAEYTGIRYVDIVVAAVIPAILYYFGILTQVHLYCLRHHASTIPTQEIQGWKETLQGGWLFVIPLIALLIPLIKGYSATYAALIGTAALMVCALFKREARLTPKRLYDILSTTTIRMVGVTAACAAAGIVIDGITMTGLTIKFTSLILLLAGSHVFWALVCAALVTVLLGMGTPTPSAYILAAVLLGPVLVGTYGLPLMNAHLFILYFAVLSAMTPPVAVAAYAAASLCDADPIRIAARAVRLAVFAFVAPFAIIYNPGLILEGTWWQIGLATIQCALATLLCAMGAEGHYRGRIPWYERIMLFGAGLTLLGQLSVWVVLASLVGIAGVWRLHRKPLGAPAAGSRVIE